MVSLFTEIPQLEFPARKFWTSVWIKRFLKRRFVSEYPVAWRQPMFVVDLEAFHYRDLTMDDNGVYGSIRSMPRAALPAIHTWFVQHRIYLAGEPSVYPLGQPETPHAFLGFASIPRHFCQNRLFPGLVSQHLVLQYLFCILFSYHNFQPITRG